MNANSLLARLEELKKWQEKQQERLLQQQQQHQQNGYSHSETPIISKRNEEKRTLNGSEHNNGTVVVTVAAMAKPKKPYLKRGSGLIRYKMTTDDRKRPYGQKIPVSRKPQETRIPEETEEELGDEKSEVGSGYVASPLKVPDCKLSEFELNKEKSEGSVIIEESLVKETIHKINEKINIKNDADDDTFSIKRRNLMSYGEFRELNLKQFFPPKEPIEEAIEDLDETDSSVCTVEDKSSERELLIFEALEEKLLNCSFDSTNSNSSLMKILSSTPNKLRKLFEKPEEELTQSEEISEEKSTQSEETSGMETETDSCCSSTSEIDTTLENEEVESKKNTQRYDEILTEKLKELDFEIQNFRVENAKLQRKKIELEKDEENFRKLKKEFEKYVLEEKIKLEFYLEEEKKKFGKEKLAFERQLKEFQNKTNRKEKEEIANLKNELANVREAAKLKETRNATSQARLRNQIKSYEKEISNLKEETENLRKQNAKLVNSQKYNNKKSDTKVLSEINKNLLKLNEQNERISPILKNPDPSEDVRNKSAEKITIESPETLEKKVDDNLLKTYEEVFGNQSKTETTLPDNSKEIRYSNGNVKLISPNGNLTTLKYFNGDVKETNSSNGIVRYYYKENESWHTTYPDGTELIEFKDGQTETKHRDGKHEVKLPTGIVKVTNSDRSEVISYPDGTRVTVGPDGDKEIRLPNGEKEIHTKAHMRREYLDGTVKIVYPDGIQETRYGNGRIRIKDKNGKLLLDSHQE